MFGSSIRRSVTSAVVSSYRNYSIISTNTNKIPFNNRNISQIQLSYKRWSSTDSKENPIPETEATNNDQTQAAQQEVDDLGDKVVNADAEKIMKLEKDVKDLKDRVI